VPVRRIWKRPHSADIPTLMRMRPLLSLTLITLLGSSSLLLAQPEDPSQPDQPAVPTESVPAPIPAPPPMALPPAALELSSPSTGPATQIQELQAQRLQDLENHWRDRLSGQERQMVMMTVLLLLVTPAAFAFGVAHARYRQQQEFQNKLRLLIERNIPIPAELLSPATGRPPVSDLRKGVLLIATGIAMMFLLGILLHPDGWSLGLIPIFIGLTYLVLRRLERNRVPQQ
jgi:hypothetical protein